MLFAILFAIIAFIGTNIDDILVLTILLSAAKTRRERLNVRAGYMLGVILLTALSALAAGGLRLFSGEWLRMLGLIPIALGVRAMLKRDNDDAPVLRTSASAAALITLGNGADNLGVYIPLFARLAPGMIALSAAAFLLMAALWGLLAAQIASLPALRRFIERRAGILVPAVFILLGLYILLL